MKKLNIHAYLLCSVMAMTPWQAAQAQSADAASASDSNGGLEDIVVTARKRQESLQDIGSAVSALSPSELLRRPDIDLSSFANAAPSVVITDMQEGPGSPASMTIRGIGTSDHERSIDPTVGVVVDGVFIGTVGGAMVKAIDINRLEILRGPQGTLFGRNSIGGAILLDRVKPDASAFSGKVRGAYGNYDDVMADGYINVPLGEGLAVKFGGAFSRHDGYFYNLTLDRPQGYARHGNVNIAASWDPTDNLKLYYRFDKDWNRQDAAALQNVAQPDQAWCFFYNQCAPNVNTPQGGDRYVTVQNSPGENAFFNSNLHVGSINWDLGSGFTFDYLFGLFKTNENGHWDFDGTPLTLYDTDRPQTYRQMSHEARISFNNGGAINFTAGIYSFNARYQIFNFSTIGFGDLAFGLPPGTILEVPQTVGQKTRSYAAFFEGDLKVMENLTLTVGGRYTKDRKSQSVDDPLFSSDLEDLGGFSNPARKSWDDFSPKVGIKYRVNDDVMLYGLYSKGFRAGGFSGRPGTYAAIITPYDPEKVDNFEIGAKTEFLDNRLRINASAYRMNYKDKQEELSVPVETQGGTGQQTLFVNAATARLQGLELEITARPTPAFTLTTSLGYLDAGFRRFLDPLTGDSLTYLKLRRAPEWTIAISPAYEFEALAGIITVSADYHYLSSYENTFWNTPAARNDGAHVVDAQISWRHENTTVAAYGRNLTKDDSYTIGLDVGRSAAFSGLWTFVGTRAPRTYGVSVTQKF